MIHPSRTDPVGVARNARDERNPRAFQLARFNQQCRKYGQLGFSEREEHRPLSPFKAELLGVFEAEDGRVVGLHHNSGVRNGKQLDTDACIVFELEDGRVTSGREYVYDLHNSDQSWS